MIVRFDWAQVLADRDQDRTGFLRLELPDGAHVPIPGETINIDGDPFIVLDRGWAVGRLQQDLYCYVRLWRATNSAASRADEDRGT